MKISSATPVLFVDRVEPTRDFFTKLGFTVQFDVPDGDLLGFVALEKDGVQVMVETRGNSHEGDAVRELSRQSRASAVFMEVDNLDAAITALATEKAIVERHTTFYGADEISFMEPGGHIVTLARFDR
ncbi:MAG TPA: VOC family protein [Usitatibacter sp.]|nr:VOC family protein [Usitatibacter sp.]